jgi:membrane protein
MSDPPGPKTLSQGKGPIGRAYRQGYQRYSGSFVETFWNRLAATDFMSKAMQLAAIVLLCFIPFTIVVAAFAGRSDVTVFTRRLGLNQEAARDLSHVFGPAHATTSAISGAGYVFFILGGIAVASAIQDLYEKLFDLDGRGVKNLPHQLAWLGSIVLGGLAAGAASPTVVRAGGPLLLAVLAVLVFFLFWWFSIWILLAGREPWRALIPSAMATAVCWVGMYAVFHLVFSKSIIGDYNKYGPIGAIFALMSFFIAVGVVIILGAVFGLVWRERKGTGPRLEAREPSTSGGRDGARTDVHPDASVMGGTDATR